MPRILMKPYSLELDESGRPKKAKARRNIRRGEREIHKVRSTVSLFSTLLGADCVYPLCTPCPFLFSRFSLPSSQTPSPLLPSLSPLPAFSTQSDRRTASPPLAPAINRRFRAIRRGFVALSVVPRRIGGDRSTGLEVSQGPFPIANSCSACALPGLWGAGSSARARRLLSRRCGLGTTNILTCSGAGFSCVDSMIRCRHHEHTYEMSRLQKGASAMCLFTAIN
jgi:hypothetical protein